MESPNSHGAREAREHESQVMRELREGRMARRKLRDYEAAAHKPTELARAARAECLELRAEVRLLREALRLYGNRAGMARAPARLQPVIDAAMGAHDAG